MRKLCFALVATLIAGPASAKLPLFAAQCSPHLQVDADAKGRVRVNGKAARLTQRPDGQVTAQSAGMYIDITPQGSLPPRVTYTARDQSHGACEVLSFKAPGGGAAQPGHGAGGPRAPASERAGQGRFDARGPVSCALRAGQPMQQCQAAVARDPGGTAAIKVTRPDGGSRFIFFEKGRASSADLSQADGSQHFRSTKRDGVYHIEAGHERYEIIEAFVFGG